MRPFIVLAALLLGAAVAAADPARKLSQAVKPAIVNGKDSPRVGWYVSIRKRINGEWIHWCGGMLVTQTTVLTAAHCVFNEAANAVVPASTVRVAIGLQSENNNTGVDLGNVKHIVVHPRYLPGPRSVFIGQGFDIALLELDPATVSGKNELVVLPLYIPKPRNPVPAGTRLALVGFGDVVGNETYPTTLQRTDLVLERLETCNEAWADKPHTANFFESTAICAGAPPTNPFTDACPGDSGGPLYVPRTAARPYDTAIGLVSYGDDCLVQFDKTRYGRPGVYTNIAQLKRWVKANLACLAQGQICPWGGTCFDNPANGCATCDILNPTACGTCTLPGYVPDQEGQCRPADCRDVIENCVECAHPRRRRHNRHHQPQCAACRFGYKVVNNQCVLKTCLDYVRGCQQCDPASPLTCTACKRHFAFDIPTGQCVPLRHV